jgi:hypothetical protein
MRRSSAHATTDLRTDTVRARNFSDSWVSDELLCSKDFFVMHIAVIG